ncbi:MAG: hypothetical protein OEY49_08720, partial [Candidatus Heimdallarchaeota archaeon]|nr:hypothetical protein [Candidatus Heimdallarchaeota archaeon]
MKNKLNSNLRMSLLIILTLALLINPFTLNVTANATTTLETGDTFRYSSQFVENWSEDYTFNIKNVTGGNLLRYEGQQHSNDLNANGNIDFRVVRGIQDFPDVAILMDMFLLTLSGTQDSWSNSFYDAGNPNTEPGSNGWFNESQITPNVGNSYHSRQTLFSHSNTTYSIIPPGSNEDRDLGNWNNYWVPVDQYFVAPVTGSYVTTQPRSYMINNANVNLNIINVTIVWSLFQTMEDISFWMDFNGNNVPFNGSWAMDYTESNSFLYDQANGVLVEIVNSQSLHFTTNAYNDSYYETWSNHPFKTSVNTETSRSRTESHVLSEASSHYGNVRPVSNGDNRLLEGDLLTYDVDGYLEFGNLRHASDNQNWENYNYDFVNATSSGDAILSVFRNTPTDISVAVFDKRNYNVEFEWDRYDKNPVTNEVYWSDSGADGFTFMMYDVDMFTTPTTNTREITDMMPDNLLLEMPNPDGNNNDDGDGSFPGLPRVGTTSTITETRNYIINGFTYVLNVDVVSADYGLTHSDNYYDGRIDGNVNFQVDGNGMITLVYDRDTGVLIERYEYMEFLMSESGTGTTG